MMIGGGERDMGVITAMRAEEDEREIERKRKEKEAKLRAGDSAAFDAFHSVPIQILRQSSSHANGMLVSPPLNPRSTILCRGSMM